MRPVAAAALLASLAVGCSGGTGFLGGTSAVDMAVPPLASLDGGAAGSIYASVSFGGCDHVGLDGGAASCTGAAPLSVTLVPVTAPGIQSYRWTLDDGGVPGTSQEASPTVVWPMPGRYQVSLTVAGLGGAASAQVAVEVRAGASGAACGDDRQCAAGLGCMCSAAARGDGGTSCPGVLAAGMCARNCNGGDCAPGEACVDFTRSAAGDPQASGIPWRHAICLPTCNAASDCRAGFACRPLPVLAQGASPGGAFAWGKACFAPLLGDVGDACADGSGKPAPTLCIGGACAALGARDVCTSPCDVAGCPAGTACAAFGYDQAHPICLPRCDAMHPCGDPLLACQAPNADGWYGFSVDKNPAGATYCAPRRCTVPADCAPAGHCASVNGGASFCVP